ICRNRVRRRETEVRVFKKLDEYRAELSRFKSEFQYKVIGGRNVWFIDRARPIKGGWRSRVKGA
ncbi:MAG: hypothetical protein DRJ62_06150, partial [Thermoprotei archaeon]